MKSTATKSLKSHITRALLRTVLMTVAFAIGLMTLSFHVQAVDRPTAEPFSMPSTSARLMDAHSCWSGTAPADMVGVIPGHVVATLPTGKTVYSARLVGPALDQVLGVKDSDLEVSGFCR